VVESSPATRGAWVLLPAFTGLEMLQTPGARSEHFGGMKLFFSKFQLFSCIAVDFILRNFLLTHIGMVILTTKKYFLHRALLFLLCHKAVLLLHRNNQ